MYDFSGVGTRGALVYKVDLLAIIRPGSESHGTQLDIEREELDFNGTGTLVDGGWLPFHVTGTIQGSLSHQGHLILTVRTETHLP